MQAAGQQCSFWTQDWGRPGVAYLDAGQLNSVQLLSKGL